ncbi:Amidohydrolase 2 [Macrophomina phaseolina MS6]|uniref:Amidohydrolase 2 n=1 Tax=Macrophomina phaseolina (strain MS6) TaxID=1126212 RepID=K2T0V6_MACPH|nr:Amidohydrolase 2 [Macrophomina phaseolina MS6]
MITKPPVTIESLIARSRSVFSVSPAATILPSARTTAAEMMFSHALEGQSCHFSASSEELLTHAILRSERSTSSWRVCQMRWPVGERKWTNLWSYGRRHQSNAHPLPRRPDCAHPTSSTYLPKHSYRRRAICMLVLPNSKPLRSRKGEESPSALDECREAARGRGDVREDEARMRPEKPVACKDIAVIIYGSRDVRKHCRKKDAAHNGEIHVVAVACLLTTMRMPEYSEPSAEASCRI